MVEIFKDFIDAGYFVLGDGVKKFEAEMASYFKIRHSIAVANGTDALEIAMRSLGIKSGDHVLLAANAGMYACHGVLAIGAHPQFCDIDLKTYGLDLELALSQLNQNTKAVIYTHLYGVGRDLTIFRNVLKNRGVFLLEDCAQSTGALINGKQTGSFGDIATFSFYPTKNLGALGDGGAILTNDDVIATKVRSLRQYGWATKYSVEIEGGRNSRLDEIQSLLLSLKLKDLASLNGRRMEIAGIYKNKISNPSIMVPSYPEDCKYVAHLFVLECESSAQRDSLSCFLRERQISCDVHYPIPDHRQIVFNGKFKSLQLINTETVAERILTIPCYPELKNEELDHIITSLNEWHP